MNFHTVPHTYTGEVHLNVLDINRAVQFYKEVIGFKVLEEAAAKVVLTADGKTPLLIIEQPENVMPKEAHKIWIVSFCIIVAEESRFRGNY